MRLTGWSLLTLVMVLVASPAWGQIPPKRTVQQRAPSARLLVVTPDTAAAVSFERAVELATSIRGRLEKIAQPEYAVVSRQIMNKALEQYGYPTDAILTRAATGALAEVFQAKAVVTANLELVGAVYRVVAHVGGPEALGSQSVELTQAEGQSLSELGLAVADRLKSYLK